ncbi:hypothetical protein E1263_22620 [Kribbella antibiotica]|uniref:Uncharacterized protein n=1 Tax=Kribbella antibiotica TaxID=190195 RepID=A0A4R4ZJF5_9ACTN|nr:hypothetical protein [Kribbella antibiotica]TDD57689.1 hypothetical protein E1263_22620 [Kribbella antibiotica]
MTLWTPPGADLGEHAGPTPDERMRLFIGGLDSQGRPVPATFRRFQKQTETWPVTATTPEGPAMLLKTSREMFAHGFYVYEFIATSCAWAINAVETALKLRLEQPGSFKELITATQERGILSPRGLFDPRCGPPDPK